MCLWKGATRKDESTWASDTGQATPALRSPRNSPPAAVEVTLLAVEALEEGVDRRDVARIIGVHHSTVAGWSSTLPATDRPLQMPGSQVMGRVGHGLNRLSISLRSLHHRRPSWPAGSRLRMVRVRRPTSGRPT